MRWIKDDEFIRGNIPMTKFEIRMVTIALLEIEQGDTFLDVGAGTGSISVEAALQGANVYAIEKEGEGVGLIKKNSEKFNVIIDIIHGSAPDSIYNLLTFNKCFIGGSGGKMEDIFAAIHSKLTPGGIIAANFVTLNNLQEFQNLLKKYNYQDIEVRLIQSSNMESKTGILRAQNPVFIVRGKKP